MSNLNTTSINQKPVVLVIEDDFDTAEFGRQFLEENGCQTIVVAGIVEFRGNTAIGIGFEIDRVEIDLSQVKAATVDFNLATGSMPGPHISLELVARGIKTCAASSYVSKAEDLEKGPYSKFGFSTFLEYKVVTHRNIDRVFAALGLVRPQA